MSHMLFNVDPERAALVIKHEPQQIFEATARVQFGYLKKIPEISLEPIVAIS